MKAIFVVILISVLLCGEDARSQTITNGNATSSGECSVAHSGNNDTFIIKNCGIAKAQADKITDLIEAVLANQRADTRDAKLDELLRIARRTVNPYADSRTYSVEGDIRVTNQSNGSTSLSNDGGAKLRDMLSKQNAQDWVSLLAVSQNYISTYPGWFTPYAFLGEAQYNLCRVEEASASLTRFVEDTENATDYQPLRNQVQPLLAQLNTPEYKHKCSAQQKP